MESIPFPLKTAGWLLKNRVVTGFAPTFNRLVDVIEVACLKTFARIDHAARSEVNTLGLAAVYLKLKLPIAKGAVRVTTLPTESPRYEMAESAHHRLVLCNNCRRIYHIPGCPVDLGRLARIHGRPSLCRS